MNKSILPVLVFLCGYAMLAQTGGKEGSWTIRFSSLPVTEVFKGKPATPKSDSPENKKFRTAITEAAAKGPNFAGHYAIAEWGCGAGCVSAAVVDAVTGKVYSAPFGILSMPVPADDKGRDFQGPVYYIQSRLFIADGCPEEKKCGIYYYEWKDEQFKLLRFEPAGRK